MDGLVRRLRRDLGESLLSVARQGIQLDQATTPSLAALRAWTLANRQWTHNRLDEAATLYHRAVELDSGFAMAHLDLGQYYYWRYNDRPRGDMHFDAALRHSDRVTDRERMIIEAKVAGWRGDREEAIRAYNVVLGMYPDDVISWSNLGYEYLRLQRWESAIYAYERDIELDSLDHNAYVNLATIYNGQGRHEEAVPLYLRAFELRPEYKTSPSLNHEFGFNYVGMGNLEAAEEAFSWMKEGSREQRARGLRSMALLRTHAGRYAEGIELFRQSVLLSQTGSPPVTQVRERTFLIASLVTTGRQSEVAAELATAKRVADTAYIEPFFLGTLAILYARTGDVTTASEMLTTIESRAVAESAADQGTVHLVRGEIALARGDVQAAVVSLEQAIAFSETGDARTSLAAAYVLAGDPAAASR
jgi:tetratricopeptide (TPR) repeat protein